MFASQGAKESLNFIVFLPQIKPHLSSLLGSFYISKEWRLRGCMKIY